MEITEGAYGEYTGSTSGAHGEHRWSTQEAQVEHMKSYVYKIENLRRISRCRLANPRNRVARSSRPTQFNSIIYCMC